MAAASVYVKFGQQQLLDQPARSVKLAALREQLQKVGKEALSILDRTPATRSQPSPLIAILQDLLACQSQDPRAPYKEADKLQELYQAVQCCSRLVPGYWGRGSHAHTIQQLVSSLLLLLSGRSQHELQDIDKAIQQQQLLQAAVAKHMPDLLSILLPGAEDSTVHAALNCLATGLGAFKAEGESEQAVTVLPSIGAFVHHLLPVMNNALTDLPVNSGEATDLSMLCELLTLAIKTFKSAVEVCMRERGPEQDTCAFLSRDFASMSHITTLLNWQALLSPTYMEMPQCTAVLASLLEIEAVWGLAVDPTANAGRSVPMLHDLLSNGYRLADVLYQFLPGEALCSTPTTSFLGFLVLIKQTVKAATLLKAGEKHVQELLLMPISGSSSWGSINLLEILWYLLETRSPVSCIACRLIEVYTLCVQHATEWPQVAVFLIHDMNLPKVVIHKLSKLTDPKQRPDRRSHARQLAAEERALSLKMVRMLLDDGEKLLTKSHKVALQQLHKRWMPDVPLWDGKTIEHRATVNPDAVDVGDEAPASWEGPHLQPDASRQDQHKALQASTNCRNIALRQSSVTSTEADALAKQIAENTRKIKALKRQAAAKKQKLRDACSKQQQKASVQVEPTAKVTSQAQSKVADVQMPTNPPSSDAAPARQQGELSAKVTDHSTESPGPPNTFQLQQSGNDSPAAAKSCAVLSASSPSESKPSHLSKDQGQHRNVSCETRNRPTAESLSCNQSAKDNAISAAIRRTSHAGLAAAISQQSLDALKSNVPQILLEPRKSGLTCHTASLSQQVTADTLQYQSQSSQIISVAPSQHEPMTRSVANSDWHGHADYQASPQTQQADTAMSMDIDSANIWSPPCCDQSGPFGQLPGPALGHPSRQQAGSCDRSAWHDNVHAQHATAQAQQVWDEHADPMDIDIETNLC